MSELDNKNKINQYVLGCDFFAHPTKVAAKNILSTNYVYDIWNQSNAWSTYNLVSILVVYAQCT